MNKVCHPGLILKNLLPFFGLSQSALAKKMDIPLQRINTIINGKRGITPDTALLLSKHLNAKTAEEWMHLQVAWDLQQAMIKNKLQGIR